MSSLRNHLLVASPYLSDRNFFRSVVLVVTHDESHAFGLLLNRPGHCTLAEFTEDDAANDNNVRVGGPLDGPLLVVHQDEALADAHLLPNIFLSTRDDSLANLAKQEAVQQIPICGYSGWGPRQLDEEMAQGGWMSMIANADIVFAPPAEMWHRATRQISDEVLAGVPAGRQDPRWN